MVVTQLISHVEKERGQEPSEGAGKNYLTSKGHAGHNRLKDHPLSHMRKHVPDARHAMPACKAGPSHWRCRMRLRSSEVAVPTREPLESVPLVAILRLSWLEVVISAGYGLCMACQARFTMHLRGLPVVLPSR